MTEKNRGFVGRNIRLEITSEVINNRREYFMTRKYDDGAPDESVPIDFHTKHFESGQDPFKLYKEEQTKEKEREKEEALNKPVEQTK